MLLHLISWVLTLFFHYHTHPSPEQSCSAQVGQVPRCTLADKLIWGKASQPLPSVSKPKQWLILPLSAKFNPAIIIRACFGCGFFVGVFFFCLFGFFFVCILFFVLFCVGFFWLLFCFVFCWVFLLNRKKINSSKLERWNWHVCISVKWFLVVNSNSPRNHWNLCRYFHSLLTTLSAPREQEDFFSRSASRCRSCHGCHTEHGTSSWKWNLANTADSGHGNKVLVSVWDLYPFQNPLELTIFMSIVYFSRDPPIIKIPTFSVIFKFWNAFIVLGLHLILCGFYAALKWKLQYTRIIYLLWHLVFQSHFITCG